MFEKRRDRLCFWVTFLRSSLNCDEKAAELSTYCKLCALSAQRLALSKKWALVMEPGDFKKWRKSLRLSQKDAANLLGLKRRMIQYYEKGERDGEQVAIPRSVRLACYAISEGVSDYNGPHRKTHFINNKEEG